MTLKTLTVLTLGLGLIAACGDHDDGSTDDSTSSEDDTGDTGSGEIEVSGQVNGTITVALYDDSSGEILSVEYADVGYNTFPFGKIFVGAYTEVETEDGETRTQFHGDTTIDAPSIGGDSYSMDVEVTGTDQVYVYAQVDWHQDRVLGTGDPATTYGSLVTVLDGGAVNDVDITILAPVYCSDRATPNCGDGCDSTTSISGEVLISVSYAGGDVATFLQGTDGSGPYEAHWMTPSADGGGASGAYDMTVCQRGETRLRGAWDSNGNELIDPRDRWGSYSAGNDDDGDPIDSNPVDVGSSPLSGYDIAIPLGDEQPFSIVPFTSLSGSLTMEAGGDFDATLPANSEVIIAALRYRPDLDITQAQLEADAYSFESWGWGELQGDDAKSFFLPVPSNTLVYLWAYADTDGDGVYNESGEFVGVPVSSTDSGRVPTGSQGSSGLDVRLAQP